MRDLTGLTTLIDSMNSSNSMSFNLSDYAMIKNGTYGKLMKAYYSKSDSQSTSKTSKSSSNTDVLGTDTTGLTKLKKNSDALKNAADSIADSDLWKTTDGKLDSQKVESAVKSFVDNYNSVVEQAGEVDSSNVSSSVKWMTSLTGVMSNSLEKAGITIGVDNKLSLDTDKLAQADVSTLKKLFGGNHSYASEISQKASSISSAAVNAGGTYSSSGTMASSLLSTFSTGV